MTKNISNTTDVRQRLLDAGEELFSEQGFDAASTRHLTQKAECNLAAVNYYFGGKFELYLEVIRRRMGYLRDKRIEMINKVIQSRGEKLTLTELLRVFADSFIEPLVQDAGGRRFIRLISWEMLTPKFPKEEFVKEMVNLIMFIMANALRRLCPNLSEEKAAQCIMSVVAQLLHCIQIGQALSEVKGQVITSFTLQQRIDHIVEFSAAAIRGLNENSK
jgi:AcrR family transcriptional regulator